MLILFLVAYMEALYFLWASNNSTHQLHLDKLALYHFCSLKCFVKIRPFLGSVSTYKSAKMSHLSYTSSLNEILFQANFINKFKFQTGADSCKEIKNAWIQYFVDKPYQKLSRLMIFSLYKTKVKYKCGWKSCNFLFIKPNDLSVVVFWM